MMYNEHSYTQRKQKIAAYYDERIDALIAKRKEDYEQLRREWARENGYPISATVTVDVDGYEKYRESSGCGVPTSLRFWVNSGTELFVYDVNKDGFVILMPVGDLSTYRIPPQFVSLSEDAK